MVLVRNLTIDEIVYQIETILSSMNIEDISTKGNRFQIMFMSMGEPMLNWINAKEAIIVCNSKYPKAELLISTIAPNCPEEFGELLSLSKKIKNIGLQFSIHKSVDKERDILIPYTNKYNLEQIRDYDIIWWKETERHPYLNYCIDGTNNSTEDLNNLHQLFSPIVFNFTFSIICSINEKMIDAGYKNLDTIREFESSFSGKGYNTRIFNLDGQDDIGGGCGQLWYVQKWMKEHI